MLIKLWRKLAQTGRVSTKQGALNYLLLMEGGGERGGGKRLFSFKQVNFSYIILNKKKKQITMINEKYVDIDKIWFLSFKKHSEIALIRGSKTKKKVLPESFEFKCRYHFLSFFFRKKLATLWTLHDLMMLQLVSAYVVSVTEPITDTALSLLQK